MPASERSFPTKEISPGDDTVNGESGVLVESTVDGEATEL